MEKVKNISKYNSILLYLAIGFALFGLLIFIVTIVLTVSDSTYFILSTRIDLENASRLGSFIGGLVGAVWTLSGIILLILTFKVQQEQFEKQQFENVFFEMLKMLNEIVNNTSGKTYYYFEGVKYDNPDSKGLEFYSYALDQFHNKLEYEAVRQSNLEKVDMLDIFEGHLSLRLKKSFIIKEYEKFHGEFRSQLSHYIRYLYNIFKYAINERSKHKDEKKYIDLIQAQISTDEMGLVFYNALSKYGLNHENKHIFFGWLDRYSFFENINVESLVAREDFKFYPETKFKFLKFKK